MLMVLLSSRFNALKASTVIRTTAIDAINEDTTNCFNALKASTVIRTLTKDVMMQTNHA